MDAEATYKAAHCETDGQDIAEQYPVKVHSVTPLVAVSKALRKP